MVFEIALFSDFSGYIILLIRLILGGSMAFFGSKKLSDLKANAKKFDSWGFKPGWFWGNVVVFTELLGGIAIVLGIFAWLGAILISIHLLVGLIWKIKRGNDYEDYSYNIVLICLCLIILTFGTGALSLASFL